MPCIYSVVIFKPHQEELHTFSDIISTCVLVVHQSLEWLEVMWLKYILIINQVLWLTLILSHLHILYLKKKSLKCPLSFSFYDGGFYCQWAFCIFIKTLFSMFIKLFSHSACEFGFYYPYGDIWSSNCRKKLTHPHTVLNLSVFIDTIWHIKHKNCLT